MQACGWAGTSASQGIPSQDAGNALLLTLSQSEQAAFSLISSFVSQSRFPRSVLRRGLSRAELGEAIETEEAFEPSCHHQL